MGTEWRERGWSEDGAAGYILCRTAYICKSSWLILEELEYSVVTEGTVDLSEQILLLLV